MSDDGNGDQTPNQLRVWGWVWAIAVAFIMLGLVVVNPGDAFGKSQPITWLGIRFSTYPGQPAALQLLGTLIAAMSAMIRLTERRLTGFLGFLASSLVPLGALVIMIGQWLQGIHEESSVPEILVVLLTYFVLIWLLVEALIGINRLYSWIKSRPQIWRMMGMRMPIKVGSILTLLVPVMYRVIVPVAVWVFAAAITNDEGCRVIESAGYMAGPVKALTQLLLLCGVV